MGDEANYGIQISGGHVNAGALAAGAGASAVQNVTGPAPSAPDERIDALLTEIRQLLSANADRIDDPGAAQDEAGNIGEELGKTEPDRSALTTFLNRLSERVSSVSVLAEAVAKLTGLIFS